VREATGERIELRDGSAALVRPIAPEDRTVLAEAFERLSDESRYRRFFSAKPRLSDAELTYLTEVDHHDHEALIAFDADSGLGIGVARFVRNDEDAGLAEAAVTVTDDAQGRGLGTALLSRLADRAREEDVDRFSALVLADNRDMLDLLERAGEVRRRDIEAGVVEIEIALEPPGAGARLQQLLREAAEGLIAVAARLRGD